MTPRRPALLLLSMSALALCLGCGPRRPEPVGANNDASDANNQAENSSTQRPPTGIEITERDLPTPTPPSGALSDCGGWRGGEDLALCTASYVGDAGEDTIAGVGIGPDGTIALAGRFPGAPNYGPRPTEFLLGGDAIVATLDPTGRRIEGWARVGESISAVAVSPKDGAVWVGGDFGLLVLDATLEEQRWRQPQNAPTRIDVGLAGEAVVLSASTAYVYAPDGTALATLEFDEGTVEDVAIDNRRSLVFATGYTQVSADLQQPFLVAYTYDGELAWRAWGWSAAEASEYGSDTRGYAVSVGKDDWLYYAGESHGGQTVHHRDPMDLGARANNISADDYDTPSNLNGAAPIGYFARLDPATGQLERGQFLLTRLSSGEGNAARPRFIEARADGSVLLGGASACCIPGADRKKLEGAPAMPGYAGGAFVMMTDRDFSTRHLWTTLSGAGAGARLIGVAAWGEALAAVQLHEEKDGEFVGAFPTHEALFSERQGEQDAHLVVWPAPPQ